MTKSGRKRHSPEQIVNKLREADTMLAAGKSIAQVLQSLEVSEATFNRWRNQYGGMKSEEAKRLKLLEEENRRLMELLQQVQLTIQASGRIHGPFRIFRGHQRAIAELMMTPTNAPEGPRNECIGYAAFCDRLDEDEDFRAWFQRLRDDVDLLLTRDHDDRLVRLQNDLIDLIDHLDGKAVRIHREFRQRLPLPEPTTNGMPVQRR